LRGPHAGRRVYRIGWQNAPPYQVAGNVEPAGLSVDLVREADRRHGIQLRWVQWGNSSESAFWTYSVDLWPLITITPERLKSLHITESYVERELAFLVRSGRPVPEPQDLANATIGLANISIDSVKLHSILPNARCTTRTEGSYSRALRPAWMPHS
jgi:ABC-type amino acid transport substrate-binding protein